jgi:hypothetical protein
MQKQGGHLFVAAIVVVILLVFVIGSQPSCTLTCTGSWSELEVHIEWTSK